MENKETKLRKLIKVLSVIILLTILYFPLECFSMKRDDYAVRQCLIDNVEEGYEVYLAGSSGTPFGRRYIFSVGAEGTLEVLTRWGKVTYSRQLSKIPHTWSDSDFRVSVDTKWK